MSSQKTCQAKTQSGGLCKLKASSSGYCHIHDPDKIAEREKKQQALKSVKFEIPKTTFSQRRGLKPIAETIQVESMSQDLRNSLWNVLSDTFFLDYSYHSISGEIHNGLSVEGFVRYLWMNYFKLPLDHLPGTHLLEVKAIFEKFTTSKWHEVYDFLELTINYFQSSYLVEKINRILERELAGYRFVGSVFTDVTDEQEIEMLTDVIEDKDFPSVSSHLKRAIALMSNRENPDYRNSIKESISAVESLAKAITGEPKATLGKALNILESRNQLHPALKQSFSSLYGYTSDEEGIRHAMLNEPNLTAHDAKFFLLSCTSFINYLKSKL